MSRSALVARTGLTRSAIRGLIGELVAGGLVSEGRAARLGTPGRPSPLVYPEPDGAVVLALDIEVDSLAAALVGLGGEIHEHIRIDRRRGHSSLVAIVDDLAELASTVRSRRSASWSEIGIGVAVAGVVRRADGLVSMAPNLGWTDQPLGHRLAQVLGDEIPISVANEADLGALAEVRRGVAAGADHVLFITGEVGGWWPDSIVLPGLALAASVCVVAALSLLGSVYLSTIANGIAVLMVYGAGLVAGLLGQIGYALPSQRLQDIGRDASWVLPFDALYQGGLHALTANTSGLTGVIVHLGPLGGAQGGGPGLVAWSVAYVAIVLAATVVGLNRRDL